VRCIMTTQRSVEYRRKLIDHGIFKVHCGTGLEHRGPSWGGDQLDYCDLRPRQEPHSGCTASFHADASGDIEPCFANTVESRLKAFSVPRQHYQRSIEWEPDLPSVSVPRQVEVDAPSRDRLDPIGGVVEKQRHASGGGPRRARC